MRTTVKAAPIGEGQGPTVLRVEMRRLGRPTLALSVPLDGTFYADITTRNTTGSAVTKDFLAAFGIYDPATGGFTIKWGHIRTGVGVVTGEAKNTVNCVAALAGTWDALGAIGTYNSATGAFTIESAVVLEDALTVEKPAPPPPPPPAKGDLRNPSFPSEVGTTESWTGYIYGCNVGGSRGTFRFRVDSSTTGSFGLDPGYCSRCEFSGTGPADFYIYLERYDGRWIVDDSHHVVIKKKVVPTVFAHVVTRWASDCGPGWVNPYEPATYDSASLYVNGTYKGVTPIDIELDPGTYTFEARKSGFTSCPLTHTLSAGKWHVTTWIKPT